MDTSLVTTQGLEWLVEARNKSQLLMLHLLQQWDNLEAHNRPASERRVRFGERSFYSSKVDSRAIPTSLILRPNSF